LQYGPSGKGFTYASDLATATHVQNKRRQHYSIINADSLTPVMQQYLQSFETEGCGKPRTFLQRASPRGVIIEQTPENC
jgi:hypothetical protein